MPRYGAVVRPVGSILSASTACLKKNGTCMTTYPKHLVGAQLPYRSPGPRCQNVLQAEKSEDSCRATTTQGSLWVATA